MRLSCSGSLSGLALGYENRAAAWVLVSGIHLRHLWFEDSGV